MATKKKTTSQASTTSGLALVRKTTAKAKATEPTAAQKLARVKAAKAKFKKADLAYDKIMKDYAAAKEELDAAVAAL